MYLRQWDLDKGCKELIDFVFADVYIGINETVE